MACSNPGNGLIHGGPGYCFCAASDMTAKISSFQDFADFAAQWEDLPADPYLEGEPFRFRRHARAVFDADSGEVTFLPPGSYLQAAENNPLFGGISRQFAPIAWTAAGTRLAGALIRVSVTDVLGLHGQTLINLHQVRIVGGPQLAGAPVPEGPHRDGFDYISIHLIGRDADGGGETSLIADGRTAATMTLSEPLDAVYVDDRKYTHDTTPIIGRGRQVTRDVLLMSFEPAGSGSSLS